ncbi:metal ABC transporter ATP-binding protein [Aurantimicrobium sp. MWH-Uga1]|uniref:metal ABC transporter ATP-binding protein n=1 Tax=Aurantimicrobium sp. MWH-Uga1 TaxID=2079575 RepID=UPI000DF0504A|nr:metal ABC transporter ATP-binding protein [Aurantimicrobium sp. MWH-Uga1]AXE53761.1 High-affinity zinc uptake system ATP-binding protein ZnuC [Aurantimicrobium sp. MWH-Uga1]
MSPRTRPIPIVTNDALTITGGSFSYGTTPALTDVTISVKPGEAMALIGPNGSGKSTLLKGVLGLIPLVEGSMGLGKTEGIGYLPQTEHIDPEFPVTLKQVVMMGRYRKLGLFRFPSSSDRAAVRKAIASVGLTNVANKRFGSLSGGQQQRGFLARALASEPGLLLLDEPFNGLDQPNRDALTQTIRELKKAGVAIIVTTHDLDLAREVCDTVLFVNGRQVAFGPKEEVLTLANLQEVFSDFQVEIDEHTVVVPGHEGH